MAKTGERPTAWSFSAWDQWRKCPFKYKRMYIDKAKTEKSAAMVRGNRIHLDLAAYIEGKRPDLISDVKTDYHKQIYGMMRAFPDKIVEEKWGFNNSWRATGYFAGDTWLRSILDVALFYGDETIEAVDHKTGKKYDSNADQMELFATTVMWRFPKKTKITTRLVYIDTGDEWIEDFYAKDRDALTAKWSNNAAQMFSDHQLVQRPNEFCKYCEFGQGRGDGSCRFG